VSSMPWKALFSSKVTERGGIGLFVLTRLISNSISAVVESTTSRPLSVLKERYQGTTRVERKEEEAAWVNMKMGDCWIRHEGRWPISLKNAPPED
jgi:hypothetical protein